MVARALRALLLLLAAAAAAAASPVFYPDGHWNRVTQLTVENFDRVVKESVDAGKTLFVRWIASQG